MESKPMPQSGNAAHQDHRREDRVQATLVAGFRKQGEHRIECRLLDISRHGFRAESDHVEPETVVWLKLPGLDPQMAQVVWSDQRSVGCAFIAPLHPTIFDAALATLGDDSSTTA